MAISRALVELLHQDLIQLWSGHWRDEPTVVTAASGEALLLDGRRYSFAAEADGLERVSFVNVENSRG